MTDEEWAKSIEGATPADVPWMTDSRLALTRSPDAIA